MEDEYAVVPIDKKHLGGEPGLLVGVFDGHGGSDAARFVKTYLPGNLVGHPEFPKPEAIVSCFTKTDKEFLSLFGIKPKNNHHTTTTTTTTTTASGNETAFFRADSDNDEGENENVHNGDDDEEGPDASGSTAIVTILTPSR